MLGIAQILLRFEVMLVFWAKAHEDKTPSESSHLAKTRCATCKIMFL